MVSTWISAKLVVQTFITNIIAVIYLFLTEHNSLSEISYRIVKAFSKELNVPLNVKTLIIDLVLIVFCNVQKPKPETESKDIPVVQLGRL